MTGLCTEDLSKEENHYPYSHMLSNLNVLAVFRVGIKSLTEARVDFPCKTLQRFASSGTTDISENLLLQCVRGKEAATFLSGDKSTLVLGMTVLH